MRTTTLAIFLSISLVAAWGQGDGGGTSGAEFLLDPPAPRTDAMGGALDAFGFNLESIVLNPAVLASLSNFKIQFNMNPLPNDVSHTQITVGIPLLGGMAGVTAQLFNVGDFTYVDSSGQQLDTVSIFDTAFGLSYARNIWKTLSGGVTLKGIYRVLGEDTAFAFGGDLGIAGRFETPHIGQRPKAPTYEQLERVYLRKMAVVDKEKEKRTVVAIKATSDLKIEIAGQETVAENLAGKISESEAAIAAQEDPDKKAKAEERKDQLQLQKDETEAAVFELKSALAEAESIEAAALVEIDVWYTDAAAAEKALFDAELAELDAIQVERRKLFEIVTNPESELEDTVIDSNIDTSITKTSTFLQDRLTALQKTESEYRDKRSQRAQEIQTEMDTYKNQIDEELGPEYLRLTGEIEATSSQIAELENSKTEENKDQNNTRIKELKQQLSVKEKELKNLQSDPWIRRLNGRVESKSEELTAIELEIESFAAATAETVEQAKNDAARDLQLFESLRVSLKRELKRAKLKRELDLVDARTERAAETAQLRYKRKETRLYQQLLAAMYGNEEKIFQERISTARLDSEARKFDYETEHGKSMERLDDEYAFQERFSLRKIADAKRKQRDSDEEGGDAENSELIALEDDLTAKKATYTAAVGELEAAQKAFLEKEKASLKDGLEIIRKQRQKVRLIFLQTDEPFLNTSVTAAGRNLGTPVQFAEEAFPLPMMVSTGLAYTLLNIDNHRLIISVQGDLPLAFESEVPFYEDIEVNLGLEYGFFDIAFIRGGYTFNSVDKSFSAGFGVRLSLGFTEYSVDYAFRPATDYGLVHSFGVSITF